MVQCDRDPGRTVRSFLVLIRPQSGADVRIEGVPAPPPGRDAVVPPDDARHVAAGNGHAGALMGQVPPAPLARELARRALRHEAGEHRGAETLAEAGERACARLRRVLVSLIGSEGFDALASGALQLARTDLPALARLAFAGESEYCLEGAREFAAGRHPEEVAAGLTAILAHLFHLLGTLIGEDLTARIVLLAWPDLDLDGVAPLNPEVNA